MKTKRIAPGYYEGTYQGCKYTLFQDDKGAESRPWEYTITGGKFGATTLTQQDFHYLKRDALATVQAMIERATFIEGLGWCL